MKKIILVISALSIAMSSWAYDFTSGGIYYNITSSTTPYKVMVTYGTNNYSGSIAIPSTVTYNSKNYSVTSIGDYCFDDCSGLTNVTIPSTVTSIGGFAFSKCINLKSVIIPSLITSIGDFTFEGCSSLTSVTIPSSVTSIGDFAFELCSKLVNITIPTLATSIVYIPVICTQ